MRKIVLFMHLSLDGFVGGPNGEMDWIKVDDEMFDYAGRRTDESDTALYGRITYDMMQSYWPTAGDQPGASRHDIEHSRWYNRVTKVVASRSMKETSEPLTKIIRHNITDEIAKLQQSTGRDILIFGSPSVAHQLMHNNQIDDYWLFVNPVLLGDGIPMFKEISRQTQLKLQNTDQFASGVVCLHYSKNAD